MPPCESLYMVNYLFEIGPTLPGAMGDVELSHSEIACWQSNIGITLNHWESRTLKRISKDYLNECRKATSRDREAPWPTPEFEHAFRAAYAAASKANLRSLAQ